MAVRKKRRSAVTRVIGWLIGLAVLGGAAAAGAGMWLYASYTAPGPLTQAVIVDVPRNLDRMKVAHLLREKGVVSDAVTMGVAAIVQGYRGANMKAGEYEFPPGASMADVFNIMASGRVVTYKFTVPEGWTSEMAVNRLREQEPMVGEVAVIPPEGTVIANTYLYARGRERQDLLDQMIAAQAKLVDDVWSRRPADSIIKTKEELVTLASIVEKETAKPEERPRVAAVFLNRLKAGMRLQSDPTIIYGLVGGKGKLDRPITQSDIDTETPYNTYRINGLPPGPIATPGKESLEAVINPAPVSDLYFVADGTGGHVFAATLDEHNANVRKWRAIEAGLAAPAAPVAPAAPQPEASQDGAAPAAPPPAAEAAPAPEQPVQPQPQQPALPVPEEEVAAATPPAADAPAAPAEPPAAEQPSAETPPAQKPAAQQPATETPAASAEAAPPAAAKKPALKPGTMVKVGKTLVPIPALKKKKP